MDGWMDGWLSGEVWGLGLGWDGWIFFIVGLRKGGKGVGEGEEKDGGGWDGVRWLWLELGDVE